MPEIKVTNRKLVHIYDRWDKSLSNNGRKTLYPDKFVYVTEETLQRLNKVGIKYTIRQKDVETLDVAADVETFSSTKKKKKNRNK